MFPDRGLVRLEERSGGFAVACLNGGEVLGDWVARFWRGIFDHRHDACGGEAKRTLEAHKCAALCIELGFDCSEFALSFFSAGEHGVVLGEDRVGVWHGCDRHFRRRCFFFLNFFFGSFAFDDRVFRDGDGCFFGSGRLDDGLIGRGDDDFLFGGFDFLVHIHGPRCQIGWCVSELSKA